MDDDACTREFQLPRAAYVSLRENRVDEAFENGPASQELLQATSLVMRALHDTTDVGERRGFEGENTEEIVKVEVDENTASRIRTFDRLVRKTLKTEEHAREFRIERGEFNTGRMASRSLKLGESSENLSVTEAPQLGNSTKDLTSVKGDTKTTVHKPSNKVEHSFVTCCCGKADPSKKFQPSNNLEHTVVRCFCGGGDKRFQPSNEREFALVRCFCGRPSNKRFLPTNELEFLFVQCCCGSTASKTYQPSNRMEHAFVQCCCGGSRSDGKIQPSNELEHGVVRCFCGGAKPSKTYQPSNRVEHAFVRCCCGRA